MVLLYAFFEKNAEEYSRGYRLKVFEDYKVVKMIEDLPDFFVVTDLGNMLSKTVMGDDYQNYVDENAGDYPRGYRVHRYEGNDLAEVIESDLDY